MKYRPDEIDPVVLPQLFYLLWYCADTITPERAFRMYEAHWRFVTYAMMSNDERIDELSVGVFKPYFDDLGEDRRVVIVELET